ncbi:single-stranded DNA-binding protein [Clostridium sp.]|uniref:single-stranded DNA-binding protein n=1 Tax=Clostridium sp. TaxID=1506 RepID=UPI002621679B|nr:single-stranded DNA-binding protein [Clostridium sp.]
MAKKNCVHVMGYMDRLVEENEGKLYFTVKIRKNKNKFVYPTIEISTKRFPDWIELAKEKMVIIEGTIKTDSKEVIVDCPKCARRYKDIQVNTTIAAQKMFIVDAKTEESYINKVMLLGTVCKELEFKYIESTYSTVANMKYQIAVNGKEVNVSDYPWISTFAKQAEEDKKRIQVGSQIMVEGELITRYINKEYLCECGQIIKNSHGQTEVSGTAVEYLNNCKFDEEEGSRLKQIINL